MDQNQENQQPLIEGNVVVIDDDKAILNEIVSFLKEHNTESIAFESGLHAVRHMEQMTWRWIPRLVITDIAMDKFGGYQLMRRIAELYPNKDIPIIVISQHYSSDYVYEAEVAGACKFLKKPLDLNELKESIINISKGKTELTLKSEIL